MKFTNTKNKKCIAVVASFAVVLIMVLVWIIWGNTTVALNKHIISDSDIPENFDGFYIAQVSDLHNAEMGDNNEMLIQKLEKCQPDIIAITGDLIDCNKTQKQIALDFAEKAVEIAPCYYVTGNHEAIVNDFDDFKQDLIKLGVIVLDDSTTTIEQKGQIITICGVNDPSFQKENSLNEPENNLDNKLKLLKCEDDSFTILLSHRPEFFDVYVDNDVDLVLTGHAHGGQFRLPVVGGVFAPGQGLFPEYDSGVFTEDNTTMVVSRGIGNSVFPIRINNRPEIVIVELNSK